MSTKESLKRDLEMMRGLETLTSMLEQTATRRVAKMRTDILNSRNYFDQVWRIYGILRRLTPPAPEVVHKHLVVGIGIDWGMSGSLPNRVMDKVVDEQKINGSDLLIAGKMSHSRFRSNSDHTIHFFSSPKDITLEKIRPIYKTVAGYERSTIVYPRFSSLSTQEILTASFSIGGPDKDQFGERNKKERIDPERFIVYPNPQDLANYLNEAIVGLTIHHYFAESILAYSAAQMVAMRNSHDNAKNEGKHTQILYNKARREDIDSKLRELYGSRIGHALNTVNDRGDVA